MSISDNPDVCGGTRNYLHRLRRYIQREMLIDEGAVLGRHVLMEPPEQLKALQLLQMTIIKIGKRKKEDSYV